MRVAAVTMLLLALVACNPQTQRSVGAEVQIGTNGTTVSPSVEFRRGNVGVALSR